MENASDVEIFEFAKNNDFSVVTFDSDFIDLNLLKGTPPKIIWIRTGNLTTKSVAEILLKNEKSIKHFLAPEQKEEAILEIIKNAS